MNKELKDIYLTYDFMFSSIEEMIEFIKKAKIDLNDKEKIIYIFNDEINKAINNKMKKRKVLNKIARKYITESNTFESAYMQLANFESILNIYNIKINNKLCTELISSSLLIKNNLKLIYNNDKINYINIDSNIVNSLITAWTNIIGKNKLIEEIDLYNVDISKMDTVALYLKSASPELLTLEEEELYGSYLLSEDEKKRAEGKHQFAIHNVKLVYNNAKSFIGRGLELTELLSSGMIGLFRACDRYDVTQGYSFGTYATWYIRQEISRDILETAKQIRIPVYVQEYIAKIRVIISYLEKVKGHSLTDLEIANEIGVEEYTIKKLVYLSDNPVSLNTPVGSEEPDSAELGDFIEDENSLSVEDQAINTVLKEELFDLMKNAKLTDREIDVLKYRNGFYGRPLTYRETGRIFNVSHERIRQIEFDALYKLRKLKKCEEFANMLDNPSRGIEVLRQARSCKKKKDYKMTIPDEAKKEIRNNENNILLTLSTSSEEYELIDMYMYNHGLINTESSGLSVINQVKSILSKIDTEPLVNIFTPEEYIVFGLCLYNSEGKLISPSKLSEVLNKSSNICFQIYRNALNKTINYLKKKGHRFELTENHEKKRKLF